MFPVYMKFDRDAAGAWHVMFLRDGRNTGMPRTYDDFDVVFGLAHRGGAIKCLADKQAIENAGLTGRGGCTVMLTSEQMERL